MDMSLLECDAVNGGVVPEDEGDKILLKRRTADLAHGATYRNLRNLHQYHIDHYLYYSLLGYKVKVKVRFHPVAGHTDPEGE